jgi:hypothetical protein
MRRFPCCALILVLLAPLPAIAEILRLDVQRVQQRFEIEIEALFDAPPDLVRDVMSRPEAWPDLTRSIRASRLLSAGGASHYRVETEFYHCVLFFCRTLRKVSDFTVDDAGDQTGLSVSGEGDFAFIREVWRIRADNGRTRLQFSAEMIPGFIVPPFIGVLLVRTALRDMLTEIERSLVGMDRSGEQPG